MRRSGVALERDGGVDIAKVEGRVKDADECIRKFVRKYRPALEESNTAYDIQSYITDLVGVRVVCLYEDELEKIAQIVRAHFAVIDVTDKVSAVESTEASFGYKGLHLDLRLSAAERTLPEHAAYAHLPFELQVRTIIQDSWSVLDHRIKYKKSIPGQLKRRINVLSALFELADREFRQIRDATAEELLRPPTKRPNPWKTQRKTTTPWRRAKPKRPAANSMRSPFSRSPRTSSRTSSSSRRRSTALWTTCRHGRAG